MEALVAAGILAAFLASSAAFAGMFVVSDRRRRLRAGRYPGPPWSGQCAATVPVDVDGAPETAREWALATLQRHSRVEPAAVDPWTWVGWSGLSWRSWGQELSVAVTATGPGRCRLFCSSRPRFATTLVDWGASKEAAAKLAGGIMGAAGPPLEGPR